MNGFDPIQDTFHVFAGGQVKGAQKPGEQFTEVPKRRRGKVGCNTIIQFITSASALALVIVTNL
jgi:hypothetical protein